MLIEREQAVETLSNTLSQVSKTGGRVLLIYGDAGVGKTSLIRNFLKQLPDSIKVAQGLCDPLNTPRPFGPVHDIAQSILGSRSHSDFSLMEDIVETLACSKVRYVLVMEDMHWSDQASIDWLKFFCRRIALLPVILIVSFRDTEVELDHPLRAALGFIPGARTQRLHLSSLSREGIAKLDLPPNLSADRLHEITGGNPFFISEILNNPEENGAVPDSIRDAVNARISQLPAELRSLLENGSCFPGDIDLGFLAELAGRPVDEDIAVLERFNLITAHKGRYRFRHELARLATQMRLSEIEKQKIHSRLLKILIAREDTGTLLTDIVHHAQGAQDGAALVQFAPLAAQHAAQLGAHREAEKYLSKAMDHAHKTDLETAAEIHEMWAYESSLSTVIDDEVIEARKRAAELRRELEQFEKVGENLRWLSRLHWYRGEPDLAQSYLEEAINILQQDKSEATAMAYSLRAQFFMLRDEMEAAQEWGSKAMEIANVVDAVEVKVHALNTIGSAKLFRGDQAGEAALLESLSLSLRHGFHEQAARAYTNLTECLIELGELAKAETLLDDGISFDTAHDLDAWTYYLIGRKAQLRFEQDRYQEAIEISKGVLTRDNQSLLMQLPAKIYLARSFLRISNDDARERLEEALQDAVQMGEPQYTAVVRTAFIEAAVLWNEHELAYPHIEAMQKLPPQSLSPRKWTEFFFWSTRMGNEVAKDYAPLLMGAFKLDVEGRFQKAADRFHDQGREFLAATSLVRLEHENSSSLADTMYKNIGAVAGRKYVRRAFEKSANNLPGLSRGKYKVARRHPYGLTKKEQIVFELLLDGAGNTGIAKEMSRSKRTIENHVSSILRKFGAKDRIELILRAQAEPWIASQEHAELVTTDGDY